MLPGMTSGRADGIRRTYRLAPDVVDLIMQHALAETTTATSIVEAAVRAYGERGGLAAIAARLAAVEARLAAVEACLDDVAGDTARAAEDAEQ